MTCKKLFIKLISALLLVCLLFTGVSCKKDEMPEQKQEQNEAEQFTLNASYRLVRPDERSAAEIAAVDLLAKGIKSAYGVDVLEATDFTKYGEEIKPAEFEILVGATNREDSKKLYSELSYYDWTYKIISPNVIAICGGSPEATLTAAKAFLKDVIGYEELDGKVSAGGSAVTITEGTEKSYKHNYHVKNIKLGDRELSEYSLVTVKKYTEEAKKIVDGFNRLSGIKIPVVTTESYKDGPAIFFGCANADGSHLNISVFGAKRYYITESDGNIIIDFKSQAAAESAAARFIDEFLPNEAQGTVILPTDGVFITSLDVTEGTNSLKLDSASEKTVAAGIIYEERIYFDPDGKPVRAYILTIAPGAASIETSMPGDGTESGKVSNIKNQLNSAVSNGKNVLAGINADFFDMGGTNIMRGLCIKNGVLIHEAGSRPWLGITSDGKAVIGSAEEYQSTYAGRLANAVGGSHIILKNDTVYNVAVGEEFADTRHPRTAVGIKPDGSIVLMVVDGRQPSESNGASLADLADIFASLGCTDAINLDGGGSSTFVLNENGEFNVKNSPSAGSLRAVANGLMVILP